ncbi:esterase-like activity of phytase family protein [Gillisia hiemivivida]|uniref:Esterase-like activity of phytase family protein n=1 Tax=Gillisia hiemivivida TaxID=291190 RepID=A0A5C6ZU95_9FLAO|nr:esterase-like activity of phytase family protein [Gillisia hiemivivida]TXD94311.1 esterase-like activity of phytase family protein [Gillisia hiemivivida]
MRKLLLLCLIIFTLTACGTSKKIFKENIELRFLDDYVLPSNLEIDGTTVGGLSGIDYNDGTYYLVCDHPGNPRFYKSKIEFSRNKIDTIIISEVVKLDRNSGFLKENTLDLEGIRIDDGSENIVLTSEGAISKNQKPSIFYVNSDGEFIKNFELPYYFTSTGIQQPRNNGVFEGLTKDYKNEGIWVGLELPLTKDGSKPKLFPTRSPIRITHFNKKSGKADDQFVISLENISKIPWLYFAVNGLTELIQYAPHQFLVLERAFSAGHGSYGNTVRIFDINTKNATNTLDFKNLRKQEFTKATKELVFDFKSVKKKLTEGIIDNIEGMTFGPDLPNGNKSLILISDNNFNSLGKQLNQVILMEVIFK